MSPDRRSRAKARDGVEPRCSGFAEPEADIGRIGPFRLLDELGRGGMGIVYRAWDEPLRRVVAVKVLRPEHAGAADRLRLVREAQLASRFQNDHAVTIHAVVDPPDGLAYLVMEYVQGPTLAELIGSGRPPFAARARRIGGPGRHRRGCGPRGGPGPSRRQAEQHPDRRDDRACQDHGFRRGPHHGGSRVRSPREGVVAGTPAYMSPEQARGESDLDRRTDVYGLGATLYEGLTGQPPLRVPCTRSSAGSSRKTRSRPGGSIHEIPADLETICLKAMAKEPDRRYQTARELADDLNRWLRDEPIQARPAAPAGTGLALVPAPASGCRPGAGFTLGGYRRRGRHFLEVGGGRLRAPADGAASATAPSAISARRAKQLTLI